MEIRLLERNRVFTARDEMNLYVCVYIYIYICLYFRLVLVFKGLSLSVRILMGTL